MTKRDDVLAATEAPTGLNRVKYANRTENAPVVVDDEEFIKPRYLQPKDQVRGYISIYSGGTKIKTFKKVIISNLNSADQERIARTPIKDREHRRPMGKGPMQLTFNASFYNTVNEPWFDNFMEIWNKYLRASKLAELNADAYLHIDERIYKGSFAGYQYAETAENDTVVVGSLVMDVDEVMFANPLTDEQKNAQLADSIIKDMLKTYGTETIKDKELK